jgi:hypothetical protein
MFASAFYWALSVLDSVPFTAYHRRLEPLLAILPPPESSQDARLVEMLWAGPGRTKMLRY